LTLTNTQDTYWAAEPNLKKLTAFLSDRQSDFDRHIDTTGRWVTARDLYYNYYLVNENTYLVPSYGSDGYKRLNINHFRAILKHLLSLVTAQRVSPEPVATNSDYKSQAQVDFCKNVLRYVEKEKRLDRSFEQSVETALLLGASYVSREWDATLGEVYGNDPESGITRRKGDFVVSVYNWLDVCFDFAHSSYEDTNWVILRKYFNRWDLVAKFPLFADAIKAINIAPQTKRHRLGHVLNELNDDLIPLYTFYHKKTAALPDGRATLFLDADTCLFDGALPYKSVPVERITADDQINSPFGYSVSMDLLQIQKVYNALCAIICTNQAAFGVQNILVPRECAIALTQLTEGLNAIYYDPNVTAGAKPESLNLLSTAGEIFKWIEYLESMMSRISGVNDTIRGNPEANLKSGTALAFVASQALVFISPLSRSYNSLLESTWTGIIDILKTFATTPRLLLISGLDHKAEATEFTNKEIAAIDRVIVEAGNPLLDTVAGRLQVAQDLIQAGLLNKEEYLTVLRNGQLDPLYAYEKSELMTIKKENELLQQGKPVRALVTDNHPLHVREHFTLLSDPNVRNDPNNPVVSVVMEHIQKEHLLMWQQLTQTNPAILAIQNIPPFPMPPQPPAPEVKTSASINFKDLPPQGQVQLAEKAGLSLVSAPPPGVPAAGAPPQPSAPAVAPGSENPQGSKVPGAPNLPGALAQHRPGEQPNIPSPQQPKLPPGSPAINQEAAKQIPPPLPGH
jgi:hypothetical protein